MSLRQWLTGFTTNDWLLVPAFLAVFGGISFLLTLPLGYYSGFVLPHRFGQSNQTLKDWIVDQLKGMAAAVKFGVPVRAEKVKRVTLNGKPVKFRLEPWAGYTMLRVDAPSFDVAELKKYLTEDELPKGAH